MRLCVAAQLENGNKWTIAHASVWWVDVSLIDDTIHFYLT